MPEFERGEARIHDTENGNSDPPQIPPCGCANCEAPLTGPYCHVCGQRDYDIRVAVWELGKDAASEAFELDGRVPRTLGPFFAKPGFLVEAYVAGRRRRYTGPVRIFLFCLAASFLAFQWAGSRSLAGVADALADRPFEIVDHKLSFELRDDAGEGGAFSIELDEKSEIWFAEGIENLQGRTQAQAAKMMFGGFLDASPMMVIAFVPLFALLLEVLYPRFLVIEHLLLSANLTCVALVLVGLSALLNHPIASALALAGIGWHGIAAQRRIYRPRWWVLALKSGMLGAGTLVLFLIGWLVSLLATLSAL